MRSRLSNIEAKAINHYCIKHGATPQISVFPEVRFKIKETEKYVSTSLQHLVYEYKQDTEETKNAEVIEKKRKQREEKWRPTIGKS